MACRFLLISVFLPISLCSVSPVWKTPITERRFAPPLKRSSSPYYTRPEDFKIPNYQPPINNVAPPARLPITPPGFRPNYNLYPRPFQHTQRNFYRPAYPQAYQPKLPPRNGWIYWNGVIVPPEALPYLQGAGPIPPQGAYGPQLTSRVPMSPGARPETFTGNDNIIRRKKLGSIPMSPSASPTESIPTQPITTPTTEYTTPNITPEEATMGNLFTAKENPYLPGVESTTGSTSNVLEDQTVPPTSKSTEPNSEKLYEISTTEESLTSKEYFPRPIASQAYQPPNNGPEIIEKLNVNILHTPCVGVSCLDRNKISIYTPPKGPKLLISNAAKGQANRPRPSVPEQKYLPYIPNLLTPPHPPLEPSLGPRIFIPADSFSLPPYEVTNPPQTSLQEPYSPTAITVSAEYSPPSAPPPSPPSYTPIEESSTPIVPDYNRGPGFTFPQSTVPQMPNTETTTPRLPPWAKTPSTEEKFSPTFKPLPITTPEGPTPPPKSPHLQFTPPSRPIPPSSSTPSPAIPPETRFKTTSPPSVTLPSQPTNPSVPGLPPVNSRDFLSTTTLPPKTTEFSKTVPQLPSTQSTPFSGLTSSLVTVVPTGPSESTPGFPTQPSVITSTLHSIQTTPGFPGKDITPISKAQSTISTRVSPINFPNVTTLSTVPGQFEVTTPYFTRETVTTPSPYSTTLKPRVQNRLRAGKVRVICQEDGIKFVAASILPFSGEIFANDRKRIPACLHTFQQVIMPNAFLPFGECGVKNVADQSNNQTQYHMQVVVVVKQEDGSTLVQAYMAQCTQQKIKYNKQAMPGRIEEALEELHLVPTKLEQKALLPLMEMKILVDEHGRIGPEVAAVDIGMPLALQWSLTNESNAYGFHVKNCIVADVITGLDMSLVDEHGCSTDTTILAHPFYDTYHDKASSHMWAFKVPDHITLKISCDVSICTDIPANGSNETSCSSIPTPPFCPDLITSPANSIILDKGVVFLKRRRETDELEEIQTVRAAICTSEDCKREYVALQHCVNLSLLAVSSAFSGALFLLSIFANLAVRWKVSCEKSKFKSRRL